MTDNFSHRARKRFGQNFLQDQNIIDRIVKAINPATAHCVVEIGPGQGAITEQLLGLTEHLEVIELDRDLAAHLRRRFGEQPGFVLHECDVLKFDFSRIDTGGGKMRIVGNLPYNISTPLLFHLLDYHHLIDDMLFMLQLEVVNRMAAATGEPDFGRLSLMIQYYCKVERLFKVPPAAFNPQPKVESAIVRLQPHRQLPFPALDTGMLSAVIRTAFNQRRKTLRNSLKTMISAAELVALNIDSTLRPENISLAEYVRISDSLTKSAK